MRSYCYRKIAIVCKRVEIVACVRLFVRASFFIFAYFPLFHLV